MMSKRRMRISAAVSDITFSIPICWLSGWHMKRQGRKMPNSWMLWRKSWKPPGFPLRFGMRPGGWAAVLSKRWKKWNFPGWIRFFGSIWRKEAKKTICHPCAYGAVCACAGILAEDAMLHFLYAQASAMVTNCVKLIPLSQSDGQRMLSELYPLLEEMVTLAGEAGPEMLGASTPAFDLRSIQHETLYSRLYMS